MGLNLYCFIHFQYLTHFLPSPFVQMKLKALLVALFRSSALYSNLNDRFANVIDLHLFIRFIKRLKAIADLVEQMFE